MNRTKHATERMQQRGIPPLVVDACQNYGRLHYAGRGSIIYYLDKKARRRLEREWGRPVTRRLSKFLDGAYVVVGSDGVIITTGKRFKRLKAA